MLCMFSVVPQISKEGVTVELVNVVALNVVEVKCCSDTLGLPRNNYSTILYLCNTKNCAWSGAVVIYRNMRKE